MSFGWSVGDLVAGAKLLYDVYDSCSDGPRSSRAEFSRFVEEFYLITSCLKRWDKECESDLSLSRSEPHQKLMKQCTDFIERHMGLIQKVEKNALNKKNGHVWLRGFIPSGQQVVTLYQMVTWPQEREMVANLRAGLQLFLDISTKKTVDASHQVIINLKDGIMSEIRDELQNLRNPQGELHELQLRMITSSLKFVSTINENLKRVINPYGVGGRNSNQIDYPMLRQLGALLPPQPLKQIGPSPTNLTLPLLQSQNSVEERFSQLFLSPLFQESQPFSHDTKFVEKRLENLSNRKVRALNTGLDVPSDEIVYQSVQPILEQLKHTRTRIEHAVGISLEITDAPISCVSDPNGALQVEHDYWNRLENRIEYEQLHRTNLLYEAKNYTSHSSVSSIAIPSRRRSSTSISPNSSWSPHSSPPMRQPETFSVNRLTSPMDTPRPLPRNRTSTTSTASATSTTSTTSGPIPLARVLAVRLHVPNQKDPFRGYVCSYSRGADGETHSINTMSQDNATLVHHTLDHPSSETSMLPFLDNNHALKSVRYRVGFQGSHKLRYMKRDGQEQHKPPKIPGKPTYTFDNKDDFEAFQRILTGKDVILYPEVSLIQSLKGDDQCSSTNIHILRDLITGVRSILYFRHGKDLVPAFMEWPVNLFKEPSKPSSKHKQLTIESSNGLTLSLTRSGISRQDTQGSIGSVTTVRSFESTNGAFQRLEGHRTDGQKHKGQIRGLKIDFYEPADCLKFWQEFTFKEVKPQSPKWDAPPRPSGS